MQDLSPQKCAEHIVKLHMQTGASLESARESAKIQLNTLITYEAKTPFPWESDKEYWKKTLAHVDAVVIP